MCSLINVYVIEKLFADAVKVKLRAPVSIIKFLIKLRELFLKDALVIGEGWEIATKKVVFSVGAIWNSDQTLIYLKHTFQSFYGYLNI